MNMILKYFHVIIEYIYINNYKLLTASMAFCMQSLTLTPLYDDPTNVNGSELIAIYRSMESGKCHYHE